MPKLDVKGHVPAAVTPFNEKGDFLPEAFARVLNWHMECGCGGFLIAGDNGEAWALSDQELGQVTKVAMDTVKGRVPVFIGVSSITTKACVSRARSAMENGADGLCLQPQSYVMRGKHSEIVRRFESVAKAAPLPMMVYNTPSRTGINIDHDCLESILNVADVACIKESNEDMEHMTKTLARFRSRMRVFVGNGPNIVPALLLGSSGFVSTGPDLFGHETNRILEANAMSIEERLQWQIRLMDVFNTVLGVGTRPAGYKAALNMMGVPAGVPRDPVEPCSPEEEARIRTVLVKHGILGSQARDRAAS